MDVSRRRAGVNTGVVSGSVWESRMRSDEVRGGIKVFSGDEKTEESTDNNNAGNNAGRTKRTGSVGGKRKTWKPEGGDGRSLQTSSARGKAELSKNGDEMVKEVSVSADGPLKKSPAVARRGKRDAVSGADQAIHRSPVQVRRSRSGPVRGSVEKSSVELRKVKSDSAKILNQSRSDGGDGKSEENAVRLSTANSGPPGVLDGSCQQEEEEEDEEEAVEKEAIDGSAEGHEDDPDGVSKPDEIRKEVISSNVGQVKPAPKEAPREDDNNGNDTATNDLVEEEEEEEEEEFSEESEKDEGEGELDEDTDTEPENKTLEIKEIVVTEQKAIDVVKEEETKPNKVTENPKPLEIKEIVVTEQKAGEVVAKEEETKPNQVTENPKPISPIVKKRPPPPSPVVKQTRVHRNIANPAPSKTFTSSSNVHKEPPPVTRRSSLHRNFATKTNSFSDKYQSFPERQNKLQSLGQIPLSASSYYGSLKLFFSSDG